MAANDPEYFNVPLRRNRSLDFDNFGSGASGSRSFSSGNHSNSIVTEEGLTIVVVKGNICNQTVDGLANSVGANYKLSEGKVANSILQAAGSGIQKELDSVKPKSPPRAGDIVVTQGHRLSASYVFHGVLKKWTNGRDDAEAVLRHFVKNVLAEAHKRKLKTVAIPAVGTGALNFPADVVARCMFNECDKFSASHAQSQATVSEVRLVVYEKDQLTFDAFKHKLSELEQDSHDSNYQHDDDDGWVDDYDEDGDKSDVSDQSDSSDDMSNFAASFVDALQLFSGLQHRQQKKAPKIQSLGLTHPDSWDDPDPYDPYKRQQLSPGSSEYQEVLKNVQQTSSFSQKQILKIERIENHKLWQLYMVHRDSMLKHGNAGGQTERMLWHGTAKDALDNIYAGGFNRSYCGKNATMYGEGVYFAVDFNYSAQNTYSPKDPNGVKYVFQCRVLTGQFVVGRTGMIEPPQRAGTKFRYDSVTNDVSNPKIFVIFKDTQAYPEYLVSFKA